MNEKLEKLKKDRPDLFYRYQVLKSKVISSRQDKFNKLCHWVEVNTDFIGSPASTRFHLCEPYGLLEHSCNVAENAIKIKGVLMPDITEESCVICGLFHDLGKAFNLDAECSPYYIKNEPTEKQKKYGYSPKYPYSVNARGVTMTVPQKSLRLLCKMIKLTDTEYQAILIHDGPYIQENAPYNCKEEPLSLIMHYADSFAGFVQEKRL